jgi:predicted outer membrane repeat protein
LVNLEAPVIDGNTADKLGGGVLFAADAPITITDGVITANTAQMGGGFAISGNGAFTLKDSEVGRNIANIKGGGLYIEGNAPIVIRGSLLTGNKALRGNGGAVNVEGGGPLTFTDTPSNRTMITGNSAKGNGGGVYATDGGSLLFDRVTLSTNAAGADGGAVQVGGTRVVTIQLSELLANTAHDNGGALSTGDSNAWTIDRSTLADNSADIKGGAVLHLSNGTMTVLDSTFARNRAKNGGGIRNEGEGTLRVENSTFSANSATERGGGLSLGTVDSKSYLIHATVYENESPLGGGIAVAGLKTSFFVQNTIVAKSIGSKNCSGTLTSGGGNIDSAASCSFRASGDDRNINLQLHPLANNGGSTPTHALPIASPAIDSALRSPCLTKDQRGFGRPQGPACDVGAFEFRPGVDASPSCGGSIVAKADADSWITEASPMNNFGTDSILKVRSQGSTNFRALVRFSLPPLPPGCVLSSAKLRLYGASSATGRTLQAIRIGDPWTETDVRWANQPTTIGTAATTTSGLGYRVWVVTAHVNAMYSGPNHGFLIRDAAEGEAAGVEQSFHSREKTPDKPPQLVLTTG